jgi:hypothetical protein
MCWRLRSCRRGRNRQPATRPSDRARPESGLWLNLLATDQEHKFSAAAKVRKVPHCVISPVPEPRGRSERQKRRAAPQQKTSVGCVKRPSLQRALPAHSSRKQVPHPQFSSGGARGDSRCRSQSQALDNSRQAPQSCPPQHGTPTP